MEGHSSSISSGDDDVVPKIGMKFDDLDQLWDCYGKYAEETGFPVKKRTSKKNKEGIVRTVTYCCARAGKPVNTCQNSMLPRKSLRCGCLAKLTAKLDRNGRWIISALTLNHNHQYSPSKSRFFFCNRKISGRAKRQLNLLDETGIRLNKNYATLVHEAGGYENVGCTEKDVRNYIEEVRRLRLGEGDAIAIMKYFSQMAAENSGFYFDMELDDEDHLKHIFWAHGRSREAYKEFGEVITFDTTYLTNKYDMPFAPFVGVNHHGQSQIFGCGLVSSETTETFVWLFTTWLKCMSGVAPHGIITDQDRAMQNAIVHVFPNTRHRWCLWHVMKKLPDKLGKYTAHEEISYAMKNIVYDTQYPSHFEELWRKMIVQYSLDGCEWLHGLYEQRE